MALGAVLGAGLAAGLPTKARSLWVDGLDVLADTGAVHGSRYGVDVASVRLTDNGTDQVSTLSFVIDDPAGSLTIARRASVLFWDHNNDVPIFAGFVGTAKTTALGTMGRTITVECVGIEIVLDWIQVRAETLPSGISHLPDAIRHVLAIGYGVGVPLYTASKVDTANTTYPMGTNPNNNYPQATPISAGTLRAAIQALLADTPGGPYGYMVDYYGRLWTWDTWNVSGFPAFDIAPPLYPSGLEHSVSGEDMPVSVVVTGASSDWLVPISAGVGEIARIDDSNVTTAEKALSAALEYVGTLGDPVRGKFKLEAFTSPETPTAIIRAGQNRVDLYEQQTTGAATLMARMSRLSKTFNPSGTEEWTVEYGASPMGSQFIRKLA